MLITYEIKMLYFWMEWTDIEPVGGVGIPLSL